MEAFILLMLVCISTVACDETIPRYKNWHQHGRPYTCGFACQTTLNSIAFGNSSPEDSRTSLCSNQLRIQSIYMCMDLYCPEEIQPGAAYVNYWCEINGFVTVTPYDAFSHSRSRKELHEKAVAEEKLWDRVSASLEPISAPIIPYPAKFQITYKTVATFYWNTKNSKTYGWAMYVFWGGVIFVSLVTKIFARLIGAFSRTTSNDPEQLGDAQQSGGFLAKLKLKANYLLLTPATIGTRSTAPYGWCTVPTLVESLVIVSFIVINIALNVVNYESFDGNVYYPTRNAQISRYVGDRTGIIAFANLPIVWIFAQRNNVLLWVVGWTPYTFNHFHRWIARVATVEAIAHAVSRSIWEFQRGGFEAYALNWEERYWRLGVVATIAMSLMLLTSLHGLRAKAYDIFLYTHSALAFLTLLGLFYHVKIYKSHEYDGYLWACVAIWGLDRILRVLRVVALNLFSSRPAVARYSKGSQLINLEVPIDPSVAKAKGSFFFVYVLHGWTFFQSHPFTASYAIRGVSDTTDEPDTLDSKPGSGSTSPGGSEIIPAKDSLGVDHSTLRFFIRPKNGFTRRVRDRLERNPGNGTETLRVLVEGPYGIQESLHRFDNVLFVISGSGITVALQYLQSLVGRSRAGGAVPHVHVLWTVRHVGLLRDFNEDMRAYCRVLGARMTMHSTSEHSYPSVAKDAGEKSAAEKGVGLGSWATFAEGRPNVEEYIVNERNGHVGSLAVVSCCPPVMADDTRQAVVNAMRDTQVDITLVQESFSW